MANKLKHAQDEARGYAANWRLALKERDEANALVASSGVLLNRALGQRNVAVQALRDLEGYFRRNPNVTASGTQKARVHEAIVIATTD